MSVRNGERYLSEAVDSILNQTFTNFEFIVVDDASDDTTPYVLDRYNDSRIIRLRNETHLGLPSSLNRGLQIAQGVYVARMDADDVSLPERLQRQYDTIVATPDLDVLGTWSRIVTLANRVVCESRPPTTHNMIVWTLLFHNPLVHPSVMLRSSLLKDSGGYDPNYELSQDYELWTRLAFKARFSNLPETLITYRRVYRYPSSHKFKAQGKAFETARTKYISRLLGRDLPLEHTEWLAQSSKALMQRDRRTLSFKNCETVIALLLEAFRAMDARQMFKTSERGEVHRDLLRRITVIGQCSVPFWYWKITALVNEPSTVLKDLYTKLRTRLY